jgi:hypothetical protein
MKSDNAPAETYRTSKPSNLLPYSISKASEG